ncbi:cytochrome P450 [Mycobacterium sp. CVI_P3]|uniref:Cytochrome P450 n=1 Tax=Mycobacterium pinniadriaticum TaxID=2994102 RepID=A0ABT3S7U4_9MYCO|nr:cytochrome P450 [Mycobacterium pinniadriaticum]MCX2929143.1 cytochrome P450 [Mycobacterium pinniadriaticum]MCX2935568.1 cytochrome P450 [Mycobacterium pinniadriaticum]
MAQATSDPVRLPPGPHTPKLIQGLRFFTSRRTAVGELSRRYGSAVTLNLPIFGKAVLISDPALVKDLFTTGSDLVGRATNLGEVLGPGSTFSLDGDEHRERRKLLVPPFHGKRMHSYEAIISEEVMREIASWPDGVEFATLPSMMRITLNAILRAVFGAEGEAFDELREQLPKAVVVGSRLAVLPKFLRRDFGPRSPGGAMRRYRQRYDEIVDSLIADARDDPEFEQRTDVLSLMLRARYEDGSAISDRHVADELLTLLTAGHETTATTLAWLIERIRRQPTLLDELTQEVDAGGSELQQATIWEVQRTRPVIDGTSRLTLQRIRLGEWVIPEKHVVIVSIASMHARGDRFEDPSTFDPHRFVGNPPDNYAWIPFGGGIRRCIGAAFANMEMNVTLRTLLREFSFEPTDAPGEAYHSRGIANAPGDGGLAVVHRRATLTRLIDSATGASALGVPSS